jgi:hypothetical protein
MGARICEGALTIEIDNHYANEPALPGLPLPDRTL